VSSTQGPYVTCPRCGASAAPGQEYCLECGLRLPSARRGFGGRPRRPWYSAGALWSLLALLLLACVGTAVAVAVTRDSDEQTLTATAPPARAPVRSTAVPAPTTTAPATTPPGPATPPPSTATQERPIEWPDRDGYTIVLESIPTSSSRQRALQTARRALQAGLRDVGVLASSNYASLQPGYYVVFTGVYDSTADAVGALQEAKDAGFQAYVRPVSR